jgi:uncharacterized protein (DUF983 family)
MSGGVPVGMEMESRYAGSWAWLCPKCKEKGKYSYNHSSRETCKRCGYKRRK